MSPCSVPGCPNARKGRHLCATHAWRLRTVGDVMADVPIGSLPPRLEKHHERWGDPVERFWSHVDKTATCWLWTRKTFVNGYGLTSKAERINKMTGENLAHRIAWTLTHGPIADGMSLHHACHVRRCVNPEHLEVVTRAENCAPGRHPNADGTAKRRPLLDTCPNGHPYTPENTRISPKGGRNCRQCLAAGWRRDNERRRERKAHGVRESR